MTPDVTPTPQPSAEPVSPVREFSLSPHTALPLSRSLVVRGETIDFGSDWHFPMDEAVVERVIATLAARRNGDIFIAAGDVFDASERQDTSAWTSNFLAALARVYPTVLYTPGNHCLRSREDPWSSYV